MGARGFVCDHVRRHRAGGLPRLNGGHGRRAGGCGRHVARRDQGDGHCGQQHGQARRAAAAAEPAELAAAGRGAKADPVCLFPRGGEARAARGAAEHDERASGGGGRQGRGLIR